MKVIPRPKRKAKWVSLSQADPLLYEKEAIYEDDFGKLNADGEGLEFETYLDTLQHWKNSISQLRNNGVKIPLARSHSGWSNPEEGLGEVLRGRVGKNKAGKWALFLAIKFDDEESKRIGLKGDVSIGSPPVWHDGKKRKYIYPLQHVASTNAPVIPGLGKWRAIAAAFNLANGSTMEIDELIAAMGIEVDPAVDTDDGKKALVLAWIKEHGGGAPAEEEGAAAEEGEPVAAALPVKTKPAGSDGDDDDDEPKPRHNGRAKKVTATVAFSQAKPADPAVLELYRDSRSERIDAAVAAGELTAPVAKSLKESYCHDEAIELSLATGDNNKGFLAELARLKMITKTPPLAKNGRTKGAVPSDEIALDQDIQPSSFLDFCKESAPAAAK